MEKTPDTSRRQFVKTLAYVPPLILSVKAAPALASTGSPLRSHCDNGVGNGADCRPGRAHYNNDDGTGIPGAPGSTGGPRSGNAY